jgi:hypothetical protein
MAATSVDALEAVSYEMQEQISEHFTLTLPPFPAFGLVAHVTNELVVHEY